VAAVPNATRVHPAPRPRAAIAFAIAAAAVAGAGLAAGPPPAAAKVEIGVYQDDPLRGVPALRAAAGPKATRVISVYVTGGKTVDPRVIALARRTGARLMVTWMPDAGKDGARQPRYRLVRTIRGAQNRGLVALARQLRGLRPAPILRPMPEPNTTWYAWSGTVNRNTPAAYRSAWKAVRKTVRAAGGTRIRFLWAPYARSIPDTPANAIAAYFPGVAQVDLVGTSAYNFGATGGLAWTEPANLFEDAYREISALSPKPFWIAETGSTSVGGKREQWIAQLGGLRTTIPNLAGVVWFDVRDRNGDFRMSSSKSSRLAFSKFLRRVKAA
jgi:hypothetical protein